MGTTTHTPNDSVSPERDNIVTSANVEIDVFSIIGLFVTDFHEIFGIGWLWYK